MQVIVTLEHRFHRTPDGATWTETQFPNAFWQRYLEVFDGVRIVARAKPVPKVDPSWQRVDGPGVTFQPLPHYQGLWQFLQKATAVKKAAQTAADPQHAVILRVHSPIASLVEKRLRAEGRPFGVEVVSDPWDVFAPGAFHHPLRWYFRRKLSADTQRQCLTATAASYVTQSALQKRYPASADSFQTHYSSVELPSAAFQEEPRSIASADSPLNVITVGALAQMYKGVDILIDAIAQTKHDIRLTIVGDGKHRSELELRAANLGCGDRIRFLGSLPSGQPIRDQLDNADLFVLASRQEGLPRAMIEAMARGLPCLGTTVGGIPELLDEESLFAVDDSTTLADKLNALFVNRSRLHNMSQRNLRVAQQYGDELLQARRNQFFMAVRQATEHWQQSRTPCPVTPQQPDRRNADAPLASREAASMATTTTSEDSQSCIPSS